MCLYPRDASKDGMTIVAIPQLSSMKEILFWYLKDRNCFWNGGWPGVEGGYAEG